MSKDGQVRNKGRNALHLHTCNDEDELLLPGLLDDDIVLDVIVPKLSWRDFHILSSVSRPWRRAIQNRQVYDARVRSHSTEKLIVMHCREYNGKGHRDCEVSLFSVRDRSWHHLPPFPRSRRAQLGMPEYCECVSLDGKIYILGGQKEYVKWNDNDVHESREVYVLDIGGQREWKQCASMPHARLASGCTILDGKIYVLGGISNESPDGDTPTNECLVYDIKENAWSSITAMKFPRAYHHLVTLGEKIFVHGGQVYGQENQNSSSLTEFYHPGKAEWGLLESSGYHTERLFTTQGKLHMLTPLGIYGHNIDSDGNYSWSLKHSCSFSNGVLHQKVEDGDWVEVLQEFDPQDYDEFVVEGIEAVDDELLVVISWFQPWSHVTVLHESKGFGTNKAEIVWDVVSHVLWEELEFPYFVCPIQL